MGKGALHWRTLTNHDMRSFTLQFSTSDCPILPSDVLRQEVPPWPRSFGFLLDVEQEEVTVILI